MLTNTSVGAHNWLLRPKAYNLKFHTRDCKGLECTNACPNILRPEHMNNTLQAPAATWGRGQAVHIGWTRNSHHGGFVRLSLVPLPLMHDRSAHEKFAIEYGCWETGAYNCTANGGWCGTDRNNTAYGRVISIPTTFPDGDYVVGYVWFGGLHHERERGQFPDHFSCSFVRISGGWPVHGTHRARWNAGDGGRLVVEGKCKTSSTRVGKCGNEGCGNIKAFYGTPQVFRGNNPKMITAEDVNVGLRTHTRVLSELKGICISDVCCNRICEGCGGSGCQLFSGGGKNCCMGAIRRSGRTCDKYLPPCVRHWVATSCSCQKEIRSCTVKKKNNSNVQVQSNGTFATSQPAFRVKHKYCNRGKHRHNSCSYD